MKTFYFVVFSIFKGSSFGYANFGFVSDSNNPFNMKALKSKFIELNPKYKDCDLVMTNFKKFENEQEYVDFFS